MYDLYQLLNKKIINIYGSYYNHQVMLKLLKLYKKNTLIITDHDKSLLKYDYPNIFEKDHFIKNNYNIAITNSQNDIINIIKTRNIEIVYIYNSIYDVEQLYGKVDIIIDYKLIINGCDINMDLILYRKKFFYKNKDYLFENYIKYHVRKNKLEKILNI